MGSYTLDKLIFTSDEEVKSKDIGIENSILDGCVKNDRKSQELVYRRYFDPMVRMCQRYTQDEDEIISIVNDGFLKVFKKIDQFERKGSFEGWIRRCVFTALSDYFKKKKEGIYFIEIPDSPGESISVLDKMYFEDLIKHVQKLPETTKSVFIKYCIEGYNHKEIGELLQMSEGNSKWHLHQAKKILQESLNGEKNIFKSAGNGQ